MPFGTDALVVRDIAALHAAHDGTGSYLQDMQAAGASRTPVTSGPS
jgi:aromatic-L-amino-acid decarboxylase